MGILEDIVIFMHDYENDVHYTIDTLKKKIEKIIKTLKDEINGAKSDEKSVGQIAGSLYITKYNKYLKKYNLLLKKLNNV